MADRLDADTEFGPFRVTADQLLREGAPIKIHPMELKLLQYLIANSHRTVSRTELERHLWPEAQIVGDDSLNTLIHRLRHLLSDSAERPQFIETRAKYGYCFVAPIKVVHAESELERLHVEITRPRADEHVPRVTLVEGEIDEVPGGTEFWLVVQPEGGTLHPSNPIVITGRHFVVRAYIGVEAGDQGVRFDLHVVACPHETAATYRNYLKEAHSTNVWLGLTSLSGGQILASVPVIRE